MGARRTFFWEQLPPEKLWYLVGLITSDGCLSRDGRHIDITAKEENYLNEICKEFGVPTSARQKKGGYTGQSCPHLQFSSKSFHDFLKKTGLTPNKSKTIGALGIPDSDFHHFLRGVIDGDGCIRSWTHPQNGVEQWIVKISSASELFLKWLAQRIDKLYQITGALHPAYAGRSTLDLKFGKLAAQELLRTCYSGEVFALQRKKQMAKQCIQTERGWKTSKTIRGSSNENLARVVEWVDTQDSKMRVSPVVTQG